MELKTVMSHEESLTGKGKCISLRCIILINNNAYTWKGDYMGRGAEGAGNGDGGDGI